MRFLLLLGLVVLLAVGCQRQDDPLVSAKNALEREQYDLAFYALLHAMRNQPENPAVFAFAMDLSETLVNSDHAEVFALGEDLLMRTELLLPYQPLSQLEQSWQRWVLALDRFEQRELDAVSPGDAATTGFQGAWFPVDSTLSLAAEAEFPPRIRLALVQQANNDLEAWGKAWAQDPNEQPDSEFWSNWQTRFDRLESLERQALEDLFCAERFPALEAWRHRTNSLMEELSIPLAGVEHAGTLAALGAETRRLFEDGIRWESEVDALIQTGLTRLACSADTKDQPFSAIGRSREILWRYSFAQSLPWLTRLSSFELVRREGLPMRKTADPELLDEATALFSEILKPTGAMSTQLAEEILALATEYVLSRRETDFRKAEAMSKLILQLALHRDLLESYVYTRFEESWTKHEGALDEDGRLIAGKLRIWLDLR